MVFVAMTLTDPVSGYSVPLQPVDGVAAMSLDVQPVVRAVTEDRVGSSGSADTTVLLSAAAVTLTLRLYPTIGGAGPEVFLDALGPLLNPAARPYLVVSNDQWAQQRQLTVRFDSRVAPVSDPTFTDAVISWKAPNGVWEAAAPVTLNVPVTIPSTTGLVFKAADGLHVKAADGVHIPPTSAAGEFQVTNPGAAASQWTAQLYGPATGPKLANDTTGLEIVFTDSLVLGAGQYIALDSAARSANLNNDPGSPVLSSLDFGATDWWTLPAGVSNLRYFPTTASPGGAVAVIVFRPAWPA